MKYVWIVLVICLVSFTLDGCKPKIVREAKTYKAEVEFVQAASDEAVERLNAFIEEFCVCEDGSLVGDLCEDAAKTSLVMDARMKYHTDFMLYLGDLNDERPSKTPPEIGDTSSFCEDADGDIEIPVKEADAGVDAGTE